MSAARDFGAEHAGTLLGLSNEELGLKDNDERREFLRGYVDALQTEIAESLREEAE